MNKDFGVSKEAMFVFILKHKDKGAIEKALEEAPKFEVAE